MASAASTTALMYWDLVPAIVGGVIGALAGGLPAWALAKRQSDETLRRDQQERVQVEKALAFSSFVKLIQIANSIINNGNHIKSKLTLLRDEENRGLEPFQILTPLVGFHENEYVQFHADELRIFAKYGELELIQNLLLLSERHSTMIAVIQKYSVDRARIQEKLPTPSSFDGDVGSLYVTEEQMNQIKVLTMPLNGIALGLSRNIDYDVNLLRKIVRDFNRATSRMFAVKDFALFEVPNDEELGEMRAPPSVEPSE